MGIDLKIMGGPWEQAFPNLKYERFYTSMLEGLHANDGRPLHLT